MASWLRKQTGANPSMRVCAGFYTAAYTPTGMYGATGGVRRQALSAVLILGTENSEAGNDQTGKNVRKCFGKCLDRENFPAFLWVA